MPDVALVPFPVVTEKLRNEPWWASGPTARLILSEYAKFVVAQLRMRIEPAPALSDSSGGQRRREELRRMLVAALGRLQRLCSISISFCTSIVALPTFVLPRRAFMAIAKSWGRTSNCAAARRRRHRRSSMRGLEKIPPGALLVAVEASVGLGDVHAAHAVRRSGLHRQARADVDSVVRLVHLESRHDPGRPRRARRRDGRHDRARARGARARPPDHHLSRRARAPRRARRRPTRAASRISMRRPACRACRSRSIPGCSGRAASSCAIPARSCWKCSIRSRRGSTRRRSRRGCSARSRRRPRG